ncbi:MAG: Hpt domain-containing protein, partial [Defluviitaleaceae bacterium]|nr:Hpt domain-containing protein [Defluviitaleaceae bacterium]
AGPKKRLSGNVDLTEKLRHDFIRNHANGFNEIKDAIAANDTNAAILSAHTLKSVAGLIHESTLMNSAARIEQLLAKGDLPSTKLMNSLESEITRVVNEIGAVDTFDLKGSDVIDDNIALTLLCRLEPLLESQDTECMNFTDKLQKISNSEKLLEQIENFDFADALISLQLLKSEIERG